MRLAATGAHCSSDAASDRVFISLATEPGASGTQMKRSRRPRASLQALHTHEIKTENAWGRWPVKRRMRGPWWGLLARTDIACAVALDRASTAHLDAVYADCHGIVQWPAPDEMLMSRLSGPLPSSASACAQSFGPKWRVTARDSKQRPSAGQYVGSSAATHTVVYAVDVHVHDVSELIRIALPRRDRTVSV